MKRADNYYQSSSNTNNTNNTSNDDTTYHKGVAVERKVSGHLWPLVKMLKLTV